MSRQLVCDFCSSQNVTMTVECEDFALGFPDMEGRWMESEGGWICCRYCASLVKKGAVGPLLNHVIHQHKLRGIVNTEAEERLVRRAMKEHYEQLMTHKKGDPRPLTDEECAKLEESPDHGEAWTFEKPEIADWFRELMEGGHV